MEDRGNNVSLNANSSANAGNSNVAEDAMTPGNALAGLEEKEQNVAKVDDLQTNDDVAAVNERGSTVKDKQYGDPELNKGLESQVQDREGA